MLSKDQVELLKSIISKTSFKGVNKSSQFLTSSGLKTSSLKTLIKNLGLVEEMIKEPSLAAAALSLSTHGEIMGFDLRGLLKEIGDSKRKETSYGVMEREADLISWEKEFSKYVPVILSNKPVNESLVLVDTDRGCIAEDVKADIWAARLGREIREMVSDPSIYVVIPRFLPYEDGLFVSSEITGPDGAVTKRTYLNTYIAPLWRKVKAKPAFTGYIKRLIEHLFPTIEDREFVLDWLHHMVIGKNGTMLCLVGAHGAGKGILLKEIGIGLMGESNSEIAAQAILREKFNAAFDSKRYLFLDETDIAEQEDVNAVKRFCNDKISIEKKGQDAYTSESYISLSLATNNKKRFRVNPQERRFSVPRITDIPLKKVISEEETAAFIERVKDPYSKEIAEFGEWLLARKPKYDNHRPFKGDYFFHICDLNLEVWKSTLVEIISSADSESAMWTHKELMKEFKKRTTGGSGPAHLQQGQSGVRLPYKPKVGEFLESFLYMGECRIGRIEELLDEGGIARGWGISITPDFWQYLNGRRAESLL